MSVMQVRRALHAVLLELGIVFLLLGEQLGDLAEDLELFYLVEAADLLEFDVEGAREDLVGVDVAGEEGGGLGVGGWGILAVLVLLELVYSGCVVLAVSLSLSLSLSQTRAISPSIPYQGPAPHIGWTHNFLRLLYAM